MSQPEAAGFVFRLPGAGEIVDELGVWQVPAREEAAAPREEAAQEEAAFDLTGVEQASRWEVGLPADPRAAQRALAEHEARLRESSQALRQAQVRAQIFATTGGDLPRLGLAGGDSFSLAPGKAAAMLPEQELGAWVQDAQEASFAFPPKLPAGVEAAAREVRAFFDKVNQTTRYLAWIETSQGGSRQALTVVSWGGDFQSVVQPRATRGAHLQHRRSVELAVGTRDAWIRLGLIVLRSAVQLAVLFPTNPVLALPAAYKFIRQVLEQVQAIQDLQTIHP